MKRIKRLSPRGLNPCASRLALADHSLIGNVSEGHDIDHGIGCVAIGVAFAAIEVLDDQSVPKLRLYQGEYLAARLAFEYHSHAS
jgi:hypothetical protein